MWKLIFEMKRVALLTLILVFLSTSVACTATFEVDVEGTATPGQEYSFGKLAYVQGGDIWVKTLPDGKPQRLTTDGRNREPRWSSSGQWIAFRKGDFGQVWVMRVDGAQARSLEAIPNGAFAWSPVADRLAFGNGDKLGVVNADGSGMVTLVAGPLATPPTPPLPVNNTVGRIAWSADGDWLAYAWSENGLKGPLTYQGLWKVSAEGKERIELYASGAPEKGEAILAGWTSDSRYVLFWQGEILSASLLADGAPLYSLPTDGGEPLRLVDMMLAHDDLVAVEPQGDRLAVTAGSYRATWTNKRIAVVEANGGELTWLTKEGVVAFSPAWSPDSVRLAYVAMPDKGDLVGGESARLGMMERRIWLVNVRGEPQPLQLAGDQEFRDECPLWSADGSHILFARVDSENRASLWLILVSGGKPLQVVEELTPAPEWFGYYGYIDWDDLFDWWTGRPRTSV